MMEIRHMAQITGGTLFVPSSLDAANASPIEVKPLEGRTFVIFSIGTALSTLWEAVMAVNSTVFIAVALLIGATVPSFAEDEPKQSFTCTAKTFNECLMEAPCSAWKRLGPKGYQLNTKIIFRGNPVEGETISGGTMGDALETKGGKK
jgi:hypothetical protein